MSAKGFDTRLLKTKESHSAAFRALAVGSPGSGREAAKEQKQLINQTLRELAQLRREIVQAEKEIRAKTSRKMGKARAKSHPFQVTMWGRSAGGSARADEKRVIGSRRDRELDPYSRIKLDLDNAVRKLRDTGDQL